MAETVIWSMMVAAEIIQVLGLLVLTIYGFACPRNFYGGIRTIYATTTLIVAISVIGLAFPAISHKLLEILLWFILLTLLVCSCKKYKKEENVT